MQKFLKAKYTGLVQDQKEKIAKEVADKILNTKIRKNYTIQNQATRAAVNIESFGFIDINNEGQVALTNPLIGLYKAVDYIKYGDDFNDQCWIGCRALQATFGINIDIIGSHWCVCINGTNYSLTTDSGGADGNIVIEKTDDKENYTWYRFGEVVKSIDEVDQLIRFINGAQVKYTLTDDNCQKFSYIIACFACENKPQGYFFKIINQFQNQFQTGNSDVWKFQKNQMNFKDWKWYEDNKEYIKQQKQIEKDFEQQGFTTQDPDKKIKEMLRKYELQTIAQMNANRPKQTLGSMNREYNNINRRRINPMESYYDYGSAFDRKNTFNFSKYKQMSGNYNLQPSFNLKNNMFQNSLGYNSKNRIGERQQSLTTRYNRANLNQLQFIPDNQRNDMFTNARKRIKREPFQEQIQQQPIENYNQSEYNQDMQDIDYTNNMQNEEEEINQYQEY